MPSLDDDFAQLAGHLTAAASLASARADPIYYFVYEPRQALEVKQRLTVWSAQLRHAGLSVERVSFSDLLWELVEASGRWEGWLENEADFDPAQVNEAVASLLRDGNALIERVALHVSQPREGTVVFLTETETLHPYFRVRVLESNLHDRIKVPTVIFYPGRRAGQFGLRFLGFYPEDNNYRATLIGGLS